jgi:hypothetical protein
MNWVIVKIQHKKSNLIQEQYENISNPTSKMTQYLLHKHEECSLC